MKFLGESSGGQTGLSGAFTQWRDKMKQKTESQRSSDPRYLALQDAQTAIPGRGTYEAEAAAKMDAVKNSPYLDEFIKARNLAEGQIKGQYEAAGKEQDISRERGLAMQGGTSGGQALKLQSEQKAALERQKSGAMSDTLGGIDVAEAQERTRRIERIEDQGEDKYRNDVTQAMNQSQFGQSMLANWNQMDLAQKESVFNQMLALKETGMSAKDVEKLRPVFEGMRVDNSKQSLPSTNWASVGGNTHNYFEGQTPSGSVLTGRTNQYYR